jgi:hypothetical protein
MSAIEQDIQNIIARLKARQSELAGQYGVVTRAIETLEQSLDDLLNLPMPSDEVVENMTRQIVGIEVEAHGQLPAVGGRADATRTGELTEPATYFNMSQSQAIIRLMRIIKKPVTLLEILDIFKQANYTIKAKVPYQSLFSVMGRNKAFVKQGTLWGLREWSDAPPPASGGNGHVAIVRVPKVESAAANAKEESTDDKLS